MSNFSLANLSIKRPIFITCLIFLMLVLGYLSFKKMPVDLFPNVEFPIVLVTIPYPGAGPAEVETLISKPVEEEISTLPGIKHLSSTSQEGFAIITAEFNLETDIKYAEQKIKDKISSVKSKLPKDIKEPTIKALNPADQPVLIIAVKANMPASQLYDFVDLNVKSTLEQVNNVVAGALIPTVGRAFTVTVVVAVFVHPAPLVAVTVYVVFTEGFADTTLAVVELNPVDGDQVIACGKYAFPAI